MYGIYDEGVVIAQFVTPMQVKNIRPAFVDDSMTLKRTIATRPAQRWEITTRLQPLTSTANDLFVLLTLKSITDTMDVIMPQNVGVIARRVKGPGGATASGSRDGVIINVSSAHYIPKGTFIRFANQTKIYMLTGNVNRNGSVGIYPALREAVPVNTSFNWYDDVIMPVYLDTETASGMMFEGGILMDNGDMTFVEAL